MLQCCPFYFTALQKCIAVLMNDNRKNPKESIVFMMLSSKLDVLQKLARLYKSKSQKQHLVSLLVEHVEEPEVTAEFLAWIESIL